MSEVRGVWEFLDEELPDAIIKFDPVFVAYEYENERMSKLAWKRGWDVGTHVSIWRMTNRAGTVWRIICMGETIARVRKVERELVKFGGKVWIPQVAEVRALAMRRYKTALTEAQKQIQTGEKGDVQVVNRWQTQGGMILNPDGTMKPFKPKP